MTNTPFHDAVQNINEIEITVTGDTSGRSHSYPVWFATENEKLYLIPVKGSDTKWYKKLLKTSAISLTARGKTLNTSAHPLTNDAQISQVLEKFQAKYGKNVKSYYPKLDVAVEIPLT